MWYNDLLLILMGFVALLLIVMAIMLLTRRGKQPVIIEREPEPEKILVEKGFERGVREETTDTGTEEEPDSLKLEKDVSGYEEPSIEESIEIEPVSIIETEDIIEEIEYEETEPPQIDLSEEPEPVLDTVDSPMISEVDEDVIITPNQTFYDSPLEETVEPMETEPEKIEVESPEVDITEIELTPIEVVPVTDSNELEIEEPIPEQVTPSIETLETEPRSRIRKPIIDESDPALKIDLGVEVCPHCGSNVPDTIYCIYCGKALDPDSIIEDTEE